jgi:hypothetical protein
MAWRKYPSKTESISESGVTAWRKRKQLSEKWRKSENGIISGRGSVGGSKQKQAGGVGHGHNCAGAAARWRHGGGVMKIISINNHGRDNNGEIIWRGNLAKALSVAISVKINGISSDENDNGSMWRNNGRQRGIETSEMKDHRRKYQTMVA